MLEEGYPASAHRRTRGLHTHTHRPRRAEPSRFPEIDLTTHIQDIINVLAYEELQGVVLVGHSYGGIVIAGVADRAPTQVAHRVYLDADVPYDGETSFDHIPNGGARLREPAQARGDGWRVPPPADDQLIAWGWAGAADLSWLASHLTDHPLKTLSQPVRLTNPAADKIPATYIHLGDQPSSLQQEEIRRARAAGWRYRELATSHDAMVTMPRELADLFLDVV